MAAGGAARRAARFSRLNGSPASARSLGLPTASDAGTQADCCLEVKQPATTPSRGGGELEVVSVEVRVAIQASDDVFFCSTAALRQRPSGLLVPATRSYQCDECGCRLSAPGENWATCAG